MCHPPTPPTNQPMSVNDYYGIRITIAHEEWNKFVPHLGDTPFIAYPHVGTFTKKPHFHVILMGTATDVERIRKGAKATFKQQGNGFISTKQYHNGISEGISYCKKEGSPILSDPQYQQLCDDTPVKVKGLTHKEEDKERKSLDEETQWSLTYNNLLYTALNYRNRKGLTSSNLGIIIHHMLMHTKWKPTNHMLQNKLDEYHYKQFKIMCLDGDHPPPEDLRFLNFNAYGHI